jgi:hypothetical protein
MEILLVIVGVIVVIGIIVLALSWGDIRRYLAMRNM